MACFHMIFVPRQHRTGHQVPDGPPGRRTRKGQSGPQRPGTYRAVPGLLGRRAPWPPEAVSLLSEAFVQTRMPEENEVDHAARTRGGSPVVADLAAAPSDMTFGEMDQDRTLKGGLTRTIGGCSKPSSGGPGRDRPGATFRSASATGTAFSRASATGRLRACFQRVVGRVRPRVRVR